VRAGVEPRFANENAVGPTPAAPALALATVEAAAGPGTDTATWVFELLCRLTLLCVGEACGLRVDCGAEPAPTDDAVEASFSSAGEACATAAVGAGSGAAALTVELTVAGTGPLGPAAETGAAAERGAADFSRPGAGASEGLPSPRCMGAPLEPREAGGKEGPLNEISSCQGASEGAREAV